MTQIRGIYAAGMSIFKDNLSLDVQKTIEHSEKLIQMGCHGVAIFGSTGQAQLISISEKIDLLNKLSTNENNQGKRSFRELFSFSSLSLSLRPTKSHKICGCICEQAHITQLLLVNEPGIHSHVIFSRHLLRILTCLGFDVLLEGHVHDSKKDHDECPQEHEKRREV